MRAMGRLLREASPVKVAVMGEVAIAPMIRRTPVPELPQSITLPGSAKPPTPTPCTDQLPPPWLVTSAPKACMARPVSSTSWPSRRPAILVSPTAIAPRMSERCEMDLSPGTWASPLSGAPLAEVIGIGSPWEDIARGLSSVLSQVVIEQRGRSVHWWGTLRGGYFRQDETECQIKHVWRRQPRLWISPA